MRPLTPNIKLQIHRPNQPINLRRLQRNRTSHILNIRRTTSGNDKHRTDSSSQKSAQTGSEKLDIEKNVSTTTRSRINNLQQHRRIRNIINRHLQIAVHMLIRPIVQLPNRSHTNISKRSTRSLSHIISIDDLLLPCLPVTRCRNPHMANTSISRHLSYLPIRLRNLDYAPPHDSVFVTCGIWVHCASRGFSQYSELN